MQPTTYLVGGAVRDYALGVEAKDKDYVVVGATKEYMLERGFKQVGADFPVFLHPDTGEEYALARTEQKTGVGYHGFSVTFTPDVTIEMDLSRRDFSMNSMAMDETGKIIDPFNGMSDLRQGLIRHTSEAFAEDPLRVLRMARFAARFGFAIAPETMGLARQLVANGELDHLTDERVWKEVNRAVVENFPIEFFKTLYATGAMNTPMLSRVFKDVSITFANYLFTSNRVHNIKASANVIVGILSSLYLYKQHTFKEEAMANWLSVQGQSAISMLNGELTSNNILTFLEYSKAINSNDKHSELMQMLMMLENVHKIKYGSYRILTELIEQLRQVKGDEFAWVHKGAEIGVAIRAKRLKIIESYLSKT